MEMNVLNAVNQAISFLAQHILEQKQKKMADKETG